MRNIRDCNVAVIGGAGFLGSHLVNYLVETRNCEVLVLDNLITGKPKFIHQDAEFMWCDITHSENSLRKIFEEYKIDYVFNYAAEPYIPVSFERPLHTFDINARGALMAINASQDAGVKGFLQVSSAEIYGDATGSIDENHPAHSHSTYGASKIAIDNLVQARWREAGTKVLALRQFNCIGARETHPYIVPEIIYQLDNSGGNIVELGNNSTRDFIYAGDAVRIAVELLEKGSWGEVYNLGSQEIIKIYDLAVMIGKLMGRKVTVEEDKRRCRPWEIWHLQSDNTKIYSVVDGRPEVELEKALMIVIGDYIKNGYFFYEGDR